MTFSKINQSFENMGLNNDNKEKNEEQNSFINRTCENFRERNDKKMVF